MFMIKVKKGRNIKPFAKRNIKPFAKILSNSKDEVISQISTLEKGFRQVRNNSQTWTLI